jgi:hypothetical protein
MSLRAAQTIQNATSARSAQSKRVVSLFRSLCRDVPKMLIMYGLEHTATEVRQKVLLQFRKHSHVTEPRIIESLLARGAMEREETINQWKQKGHLLAILEPESGLADAWLDEEEFFRRFLDGSINEETVWAGWDPRKMEERIAKLKKAALADGGNDRNDSAGNAEEMARIEGVLKRLAQGSETKKAALR